MNWRQLEVGDTVKSEFNDFDGTSVFICKVVSKDATHCIARTTHMIFDGQAYPEKNPMNMWIDSTNQEYFTKEAIA